MPKSQFIDPKDARKAGFIEFGKIPVNQYKKKLTEERVNFSDADLLRIYHDMVVIRNFEEMINAIKIASEYNGVKYNHPGPAHLGIGQEAAAVGMAYTLGVNDFIFGSHRSHAEILAKGLSAIAKLNDKQLLDVMKNFQGGDTLRVVEKSFGGGSVQKLAHHFLLYGAMAEIFARYTGFNHGLGGSMHAFFTPFGIYPNNAIVGGSGDISVGAALYKQVNQKPGIVVCNIGDASVACGPVWEGLMFAAMDQYKKLWEGKHKGGLPLIVNIMNNQYGMGGQTRGETMGYDIAARIGAGVNPEMMHAERVDGYNPLAVIDAYKRKREILEAKNGPVLLDVLTYRYSGHSPSDASSYRTPEEVEAWKQFDSITTFGNELIKAKVATQAQLDKVRDNVKEHITEVLKVATDFSASPLLDNPEKIETMMFSNSSVTSVEEGRKPDVLMPMAENPRVKQIQGKARFYLDADGKPVSKMKMYQLRDGLFEAIID
ncbi:MAG: thiamine pyrophosphate-dependent dehydrogenase E1 component subunit alpha, partial [Bacteroidales bacterium]|nr:thiamine pyrophosphate-dependent dehydrogenase E1 component subunit alpha [Bacteroidales bacterium]